ncbi:MAG: hypothetical protein IPK08_17525 [Bacteroidetes bacterium]|nr:hypothetical protein [Bacteroidota bacterium]
MKQPKTNSKLILGSCNYSFGGSILGGACLIRCGLDDSLPEGGTDDGLVLAGGAGSLGTCVTGDCC